jgi:hypothetical protein
MRALVILALLAGSASAEPDNETLVYVGLAMAPPTYVAGVSLHEGSHALAAKLVGADVEELHLFPPGIDPHTNTFRFGWTYVRGLSSRRERAFFYVAPKITDAALLGGFAALVFTGAWPHNRYGQLALTVGATGLWVDFSKDVVLFSPQNDIVHFFDQLCLTGWRQWPARLVYAGVAGGLAYVVVRGYQKTFDEPSPTATPLVLPILSTSF